MHNMFSEAISKDFASVYLFYKIKPDTRDCSAPAQSQSVPVAMNFFNFFKIPILLLFFSPAIDKI